MLQKRSLLLHRSGLSIRVGISKMNPRYSRTTYHGTPVLLDMLERKIWEVRLDECLT
jgi:hypothetical protein